MMNFKASIYVFSCQTVVHRNSSWYAKNDADSSGSTTPDREENAGRARGVVVRGEAFLSAGRYPAADL
eukprot:m.70867 g.70867  ORF g.70867 m.70867 type:complete len:68 (-) comp18559_c0_seq1:262-465(-)